MKHRTLLLLLASLLLLSACTVHSITPPNTSPVTSDQPVIKPMTDPPITLSPDTLAPVTTDPPITDPPAPSVTYTDVTLLSAGDIMFHERNIRSGYDSKTGTYSFDEVFQYLTQVVSRYDYAVANLETTVSGSTVPYTPVNGISFNVPDAAVDSIKKIGFDMMLFANNHTNDRGLFGIRRTVSFLREQGLAVIGASDDPNGDFHAVIDIKGTKLGMLNYTNDGTWGTWATDSLNGSPLGESIDYLNVFYLAKLDAFYSQVEADIADVKAQGADLVVCYIHWGPEYFTEPREKTKEIAQVLCDLGVDVIIGGHPHVIQPMEILTASNHPDRKTICFYSLGNFLSNQNRKSLTTEDCYGNDSANTENGVMVALTVRKYSTGQTLVTGIELIPTWVHRYDERGTWSREYRIIPLSLALSDPDAYGLNDSSFGVDHAAASLAYTTALLEGAVSTFNQSVTLPAGTEDAVKLE